MLKIALKNLVFLLKKWARDFVAFCKNISFRSIKFSVSYMGLGIIAFSFLYYGVIGYFMENIETDFQANTKVSLEKQSNIINTMAYIIDKETIQNSWTPNLPIIFPTYFLDNMPAFQGGEISAVAKVCNIMDKNMQKHLSAYNKVLSEANSFLAYPRNVWIFTNHADGVFAPSSSTQYKKGRRALLNFNQYIADGKFVFPRVTEDLKSLLQVVADDLGQSYAQIRHQIREYSDNFIDTSADEVFYFNKGKLYAYYLLLRATGEDYKNVVVKNNMYSKWASMLKCLEKGASLSPSFVRNGNLEATFAPNHLAYMSMYALCARNQIATMEFNYKEALK